MRLIDIDEFRTNNKFAEKCVDCKRDSKWECDRQMYSARDICGCLDDAPIVDAIPVDWMLKRMNETASGEGMNIELNNALFMVGVEWERWKKEQSKEDGDANN